MSNPAGPTTYDKVLELNLDPMIYGTFAEIGAGQETANRFFSASAAAGMVAKSISAYDMTMSDAIYGRTDRYVSRQRLNAMLEHEYAILTERLGPKRGENTTFFAFCNTVRARGWQDTAECHGWMGIRFQRKPGDPPSDVIVHVRMLDNTAREQREALGIVGVNLIHATFRHRTHLRNFVESLRNNLAAGRVEVDMLAFSGHGYGYFDNRLCAVQLVESGLTEATLFLPNGEVAQPAETLYKRPVLLLRGSFDPVMKLHLEMLEQASEAFQNVLNPADRGKEIELCEITMHNLLRGDQIDPVDFIDRADALQALGKTVLVSRFAEFHRLAAFLNRCTNKPLGIILSIGLLNELFKAKWSRKLAGGLLESFGRLFKSALSLYVFPWHNRRSGELVTARTFIAPEGTKHLYRHFLENGMIREIDCRSPELLDYTGRDLQQMIRNGDENWKNFVPEVAQAIAARRKRD
jgi:hypothetical protein